MNTLTWFVVATDENSAIELARGTVPSRMMREIVTDDEEEIGGMLADARKRNPNAMPFRVTIAIAASVIPDSCLK